MISAAALALGVPELDDETSAEIDGQLFMVLSALADGESFDVVTSAGVDRSFERWRKLRGTAGSCERDLVNTASEAT